MCSVIAYVFHQLCDFLFSEEGDEFSPRISSVTPTTGHRVEIVMFDFSFKAFYVNILNGYFLKFFINNI